MLKAQVLKPFTEMHILKQKKKESFASNQI